MSRLAGIGERAHDDPDGTALADDTTTLTWAEVARQVDAVGGALRAAAPSDQDRVAVVGENRAPTLIAHAAGILAGVGTVAVSRQLTAAEMAAQFRDAAVVAVVTGPAGLDAALAAAQEAGVGTVVVHGSDPTEAELHAPQEAGVGAAVVHGSEPPYAEPTAARQAGPGTGGMHGADPPHAEPTAARQAGPGTGGMHGADPPHAEPTAARQAGVGAEPSPGVTAWSAWAEGGLTLPPSTERAAHPPLVYTSGTTGRARGTPVRWAPSTVTSAAGYARVLAARSGFPDGPHLVVGPLQHNGPLTAVRHLLSGRPVVVLGRFDAERVLALVERHRVTSSVMVPTHFTRLLALPKETRARYDVGGLEMVIHTGSACPPDVKRAMIDWWGPVFVESYGGSEIGTVCRITSQEWLAHPGSVGRAVAPFEVVVLAESGAELGPDQVGVLGFRTPPGHEVAYHGDAEKTRAAYIAPGVATLGDVGYVTPDGFIHITDRIADMVVSGGVNLYPAESEQVLLTHPQVADVAVIGVPDADLGEALRALVVARDAAPDPAELRAWCRARLASYKCPKDYTFVAELPRNAMGKVDKRALRKPYWDGERTIAG